MTTTKWKKLYSYRIHKCFHCYIISHWTRY